MTTSLFIPIQILSLSHVQSHRSFQDKHACKCFQDWALKNTFFFTREKSDFMPVAEEEQHLKALLGGSDHAPTLSSLPLCLAAAQGKPALYVLLL